VEWKENGGELWNRTRTSCSSSLNKGKQCKDFQEAQEEALESAEEELAGW